MQSRKIIIAGPYNGKPDSAREMYVAEWARQGVVIDANVLEAQYGRGVSDEARSRTVLALISGCDARCDVLVVLGNSARVMCESACAKEMGLAIVTSLGDVAGCAAKPVIQIVDPIAVSPFRNWSRFKEHAEWLERSGCRALNPLELGKWDSLQKRLTTISKVDACLLIVGWELDPESTLEVAAMRRCGIPWVGEWERWRLPNVVAASQKSNLAVVAEDRATG